MIRLTVACPEALTGDANHLAMVIGEGPADAQTYRDPAWQDAQGNRYALASFLARPEWISAAQSPLTRPEWDAAQAIDMAAAGRAQMAVRLVAFGMTDDDPPQSTAATPLHITVIAGPDPSSAVSLLALTRLDTGNETEG